MTGGLNTKYRVHGNAHSDLAEAEARVWRGEWCYGKGALSAYHSDPIIAAAKALLAEKEGQP